VPDACALGDIGEGRPHGYRRARGAWRHQCGTNPDRDDCGALIACTNVIGNKCAKKHGVEIESLSIDAESTFDRRGTQLLEEIEVPFQKIVLRINLVTDASDEQVEKVRSDLHRFCPVSKLIRNAGTKIEEEWIVTRPGAQRP
jgi:putative redox protein